MYVLTPMDPEPSAHYLEAEQSEGDDSAMSEDFPSTPEHQIRRYARQPSYHHTPNVFAHCPACTQPLPAQTYAMAAATCAHCNLTLSAEAVSTWHEDHAHNTDTYACFFLSVAHGG